MLTPQFENVLEYQTNWKMRKYQRRKKKRVKEDREERFEKRSFRKQCLVKADDNVELVTETKVLETHGLKASVLISLPHLCNLL